MVLETVRIGIIGPSWWVNFWHLPAIQSHPQAVITAVCGERERAIAEVQAKYGAQAQFYTERDRMLDEVPVDGVVVCTPNDLHHPSTMAALNRGIHVTCEKPVALNATQAQEMAETAANRRLIGMTNFPYRDNPCVPEFRRRLAAGEIGMPLHLSACYHGGFGLQRPPGWRGRRDRSGAGILGDLGSHLIDLVRYITGDEFAHVCAHSLTALRAGDPSQLTQIVRTEDPQVGPRNDDSCAFLAEFASGMQGVLHTSWLVYQGAYRQHQEVEIAGTEGRMRFLSNHTGTHLQVVKPGQEHWETLPVEGAVLPDTAGEDEDYFRPGRLTPTNSTYRWIEAIRTGQTDLTPSLTDGWRSQQVIDAVILSSAERRWCPVV